MLNSLLDIEIAYNILKTDGDSSNEDDPIDIHYKKLNCEMSVLDHDSDEFKLLVKYVQNTHAATHTYYKLVVQDILKVNRQIDSDKFESYKNMHNRKLLWHGSRLTNFAGILSQGLRIAPPEAPCTGYMFGKEKKTICLANFKTRKKNFCHGSISYGKSLFSSRGICPGY
jgi:poly [ADP-ribose] polymerase 1